MQWPERPEGGRLSRAGLGSWWQGLCAAAEEELVQIFGLVGEEAEGVRGRGQEPRFVVVPAAGPVCLGTRSTPRSRAWRWVAARLSEVVQLGSAERRMGPGSVGA